MLLSLIHLGIIEGPTVQLHMSRDMMEMSNHDHSGRILVLWSWTGSGLELSQFLGIFDFHLFLSFDYFIV